MIYGDAPIIANSVNRIIYIEKEEYILSFRHDEIHSISNETNMSLGMFYLTKKDPDKDGNYLGYISDKIIAKDTVNLNVLNNDRMLIHKIINIMEGKQTYNEIFKIEDKKLFKIIFQMKNGINIIIFSCNLNENKINDFNDILLIMMKTFKKKVKLNETIENQITEKENKNSLILKKYSNLTREVKQDENDFLHSLSLLLNEKKEKIRNLQMCEEIEIIDLEVEKTKEPAMIREVNDPNVSVAYSLSDLL
jgi:hypothetical protein